MINKIFSLALLSYFIGVFARGVLMVELIETAVKRYYTIQTTIVKNNTLLYFNGMTKGQASLHVLPRHIASKL